MTNGGGLINLGELSKPATTLIEKVSDACGGIFKPRQVVRVARAEAQAEIIRAQTRIEISEMEERALVRMVREEGKKQENIESITAQAIPLLSPDAKPENMEDDWVTHFLDKCRLISDAEMQSLWARILGEEANRPSSFAKKTVDLVATLDKADAQLFTDFCTFIWIVGDITPVIYDHRDPIISKTVNFGGLRHLDDIGLISFGASNSYGRGKFSKHALVSYYGRTVLIEFPNDLNDLIVGEVMLTRAGQQLARVCTAQWSDEYFEAVLDQWTHRWNYVLSSPIPSPYAGRPPAPPG